MSIRNRMEFTYVKFSEQNAGRANSSPHYGSGAASPIRQTPLQEIIGFLFKNSNVFENGTEKYKSQIKNMEQKKKMQEI